MNDIATIIKNALLALPSGLIPVSMRLAATSVFKPDEQEEPKAKPKRERFEDDADEEPQDGEADDDGAEADLDELDLEDTSDEDDDEPAEKGPSEPATPVKIRTGRVTVDRKGKTLFVQADSLLDVVQTPAPLRAQEPADTVRLIWTGKRDRTTKRGGKNLPGWSGPAPSLDAYEELVKTGDRAAAERVRVLAETLESEVPPAVDVRRRSKWRHEGDEIDMERIRGGQLDRAWWGAARSARTASPIIRVYINVSAACYVEADDLFWPGAAAAAFTELAERAGWRVELIACASSRNTATNIDGIDAVWTIKREEEAVDLEYIAAAACNASALRTAGFALWIHAADKMGSYTFGGLGQATQERPEFLEHDDVWIPSCENERDARRTVIDALNGLRARTE